MIAASTVFRIEGLPWWRYWDCYLMEWIML